MADKPTSNVKIYDRPEKKGPSPMILGIALVVILLVGFLLYKTFFHSSVPVVQGRPSMVPFVSALSGTVPQEGASLYHS